MNYGKHFVYEKFCAFQTKQNYKFSGKVDKFDVGNYQLK